MSLIPKYHWALDSNHYQRGLLSGVYNNDWPKNLDIRPVDPTYENLQPLMHKVSEKWHWEDQPRYNEAALREKLAQPSTKLYELIDKNDPDIVIGYSMVSRPPEALVKRFWSAANDIRVMEIDNLGLFPGKEGGGRGKAFFEMIFDRHFADNDIVYWAQHDTHSPTLARFYQEKMGMTHLATDHVRDFREQPQVA